MNKMQKYIRKVVDYVNYSKTSLAAVLSIIISSNIQTNKNLGVDTKCNCRQLTHQHSSNSELQTEFSDAKKLNLKLVCKENVAVH